MHQPNIIELDRPLAALVEYSPVASALADLRRRFAGVAFDLSTTKGDKEARAARMDLVKLRTGLEAKRRELKTPALERSRLIDSEAKRITEEILRLEEPIDEQIKASEQAKEAERQAKAAAEAARIARHQARIAEISAAATGHAKATADTLAEAIANVEALEITEAIYEEWATPAQMAKDNTLAVLHDLLDAALYREGEARKLAAARAELDRQRKEQEAAARAIAAAQAEADRIAAATRAEADRIAAEERAEADRKAAAERAELDRAAAEERAMLERRAAEERAAEQARIDAAAKLAAEEKARVDAEARLEEMAKAKAEDAERARMTRLQGAAEDLLHALRAIYLTSQEPATRAVARDAIENATGECPQ